MKRLIFSTLLMCFALFCIVSAQQQTDTIVIVFDIDKSVVDDNNAAPLDELIADKNVISISIYGYADFLGSVAHNQQLSEKRSINVFNYLIDKGINKENIIVCKGEGVHPISLEENRQDLSDKGIKAHRIVQVMYILKYPELTIEEEVSEKNADEDNLSEDNTVENNISKDNTLVKKLSEENLLVNNLILLENVIFYGGTSRFRPESYPALEELLKIMKKYKTLKIEIQGHVCCSSFDWIRNEPLSLSRAKAVYDFLRYNGYKKGFILRYNGIKPTRMTYKGFGATRRRFPLEQNEYERSMNRRVEILILEI